MSSHGDAGVAATPRRHPVTRPGNERRGPPAATSARGQFDAFAPAPVASFTGILGAAAAPCALFAIGLFLVGKPQSEGRVEVGVMMAWKLIAHPALTALMVFVVLPADPLWAKMAVLMAALPTGSSVFVLAQICGVYVLRTSSAIL